MPDVEQILPNATTVDAETVVDSLRNAARSFRPFDERTLAFVSDLSRLLRRDRKCREVPAIGALAFWIRDASLQRMKDEWDAQALANPGVQSVSQGVVFHLPPTNVDTLFAYSWLMSALVGNANVVRLSPQTAEGNTPILIKAIAEVLNEHAEVARTMSFLRYGHDADVTAGLSSSDVRVIWGGDETVKTIRQIPMNPLGSEIAFADRFSMAALASSPVANLTDSDLLELSRQFFNDTYWFDQMGCSSARVIFFAGEREESMIAQKRFLQALDSQVRLADYESASGAVMQKLVRSAVMAADGAATSVEWSNPGLTVATQPSAAPVLRDTPGSGMFSARWIEDLSELVGHVTRRDQTLSVFGFDPVELQDLILDLNGAGIDRIVPVGSALQFDRYWDGWDLLEVFSRKVSLFPTSRAGAPA